MILKRLFENGFPGRGSQEIYHFSGEQDWFCGIGVCHHELGKLLNDTVGGPVGRGSEKLVMKAASTGQTERLTPEYNKAHGLRHITGTCQNPRMTRSLPA